MKTSYSIARTAGSAATAVAMLAFTFAPFAAFAGGPTVSSAHPTTHSGGSNGSPSFAHLTVVTKVTGADATNPNAPQPSDWTMVVTNKSDATNPVIKTFPGSEKGIVLPLKAGTYSVFEKDGPKGSIPTTSICIVTLAAGESHTCTFTNGVDGGNQGTAPVAQSMNVVTDMNSAVSIHLNVIAADNSPLTYKVSAPVAGVLTGTAPNLVYTPNPMYNGHDSFTFTATDGTGTSNKATVAITVNLVQGHGHGTTGQVLGAATTTANCVPSVTTYLRPGVDNNVDQVKALQNLLNKAMNSGLTISGDYDASTTDAVKAFQTKYAADVLTPWGITEPTGIAYITTVAALDKFECPTNAQGIPPLVVWTDAQVN